MNNSTGRALLSDLAKGESASIFAINDTAEGSIIAQRLRDLGFVPGAVCEVVARMAPGGDPMAVRIAGSTFALRRREAGAIVVTRDGIVTNDSAVTA
ncbi:MAG: FeoA family protein [Steroidobacteraceae bacterium]|nr:FeoA family protein [Steroidobacteraceae bacterium]